MVSEENKNKINKPSFILYEIDENIHHESHLFIRVIKMQITNELKRKEEHFYVMIIYIV